MSQIWFTSDLHFGHDREFIWGPRGFKSVYEMNETIIENWRNTVGYDDDIYVLGDLMLGDPENIKLVKTLKGKLHIIRGNHDSDFRMKLYYDCWNVVEITEGQYLKVDGQTFYLCHYPTMTSNLEKDGDSLKKHILNLYGHTHQKTNFYQNIPFMYHVGLDSHNNTPVSLEQVLKDIKEEAWQCKRYL